MRVVTPGTLSDEALLEDRVDKLLLAVSQHQDDYGIAYLDLSTGRFRVLEITGEEALSGELQRLRPAEILYQETIGNPEITERAGARSQPLWGIRHRERQGRPERSTPEPRPERLWL